MLGLQRQSSCLNLSAQNRDQPSPPLTALGRRSAFSRSLSEILPANGIRVNAVAPGPIWTPLNPGGGARAKSSGILTRARDGPAGPANEVTPCFVFLACEALTFVSGQVLHPNGGTALSSTADFTRAAPLLACA